MNLSLLKYPFGVPKSSLIQPNLPDPLPLVTVWPSRSSLYHVIVSSIFTNIWGGSYHTSAGVFNSGLYAPKGILISYSSAKIRDEEPKIEIIVTSNKKYIIRI